MQGKIQITNPTAKNCGVGLSVSGGAVDVIISNPKAVNCGIGLLQRDPDSIAAKLGLPLDTPPEVIIQAAQALQGKNMSDEEKISTLRGLSIWDYLKRGKELALSGSALLRLAAAISALFK